MKIVYLLLILSLTACSDSTENNHTENNKDTSSPFSTSITHSSGVNSPSQNNESEEAQQVVIATVLQKYQRNKAGAVITSSGDFYLAYNRQKQRVNFEESDLSQAQLAPYLGRQVQATIIEREGFITGVDTSAVDKPARYIIVLDVIALDDVDT